MKKSLAFVLLIIISLFLQDLYGQSPSDEQSGFNPKQFADNMLSQGLSQKQVNQLVASRRALYMDAYENMHRQFEILEKSISNEDCAVPESEKRALLKLFGETNGENWKNKTNWNTNAPICKWAGVIVQQGHIIAVNLKANNLSGEIPSEIKELKHLKFLNLGANMLYGVVPRELGQLQELQVLNISANNFGQSLPSTLSNLTNLELFYLFDNNLEGDLPSSWARLTQLRELWLFSNKFSGGIPLEWDSLSSLKSVYLFDNNISGTFSTTNKRVFESDYTKTVAGLLKGSPVLDSEPSQSQLTSDRLLDFNTTKIIEDLISKGLPINKINEVVRQERDLYHNVSDLMVTEREYIANLIKSEYAASGLKLDEETVQTEVDAHLLSFAEAYLRTERITRNVLEEFEVEEERQRSEFKAAKGENTTLTDPCEVPESERQALIAFYNATNGPAWKDQLTNKWNTDAPVCEWTGINVLDGHVMTIVRSSKGLSGTLPPEIKDLPYLQYLSIGNNSQLAGPIPPEIGALTSLRSLNITNCRFTGSIPIEVANLTQLSDLNMRGNRNLNGNIPEIFHNMSNLTSLWLGLNKFTGSLPLSLASCSKLFYLEMGYNMLSGSIPAEYGSLTGLFSVQLAYNRLTGVLPLELGNLTKLYYFFAPGNQLEGTLPYELVSNWTTLQHLNLGSNNLSGELPVALSLLPELNYINLNANQFSGLIPSEYGDFAKLGYLSIYSNALTGSIPASLNNLSDLYYLNLAYNQLSGSLPEGLGDLPKLRTLNLSSNQLTGGIPESLTSADKLTQIFLANNNFSGNIPNFGLIPGLSYFDITSNKYIFKDLETPVANLNAIPNFRYSPQKKADTEQNLEGLEGSDLTLSTNLSHINNNYQWYKDGSIIPNATSREYIITPVAQASAGTYHFTASNSLIPDLTLTRNNITVSISVNPCPIPVEERQALIDFYTAANGSSWSNNTNWNTDAPVCEWQGVTVTTGHISHLQLSGQGISATFPSQLAALTHLQQLDLSSNAITGELPLEIGNFTALKGLNLANNGLIGDIPASMGNMVSLVELKLDNNQLTSIPQQLAALQSLNIVSISNNLLKGNIPQFGLLGGAQRASLNLANNQYTFANLAVNFNELLANFSSFIYAPQKKTGTLREIEIAKGLTQVLQAEADDPAVNTHQWYKDGQPIEGATTSVLRLEEVAPEDAGDYWVKTTHHTVVNLTLEQHPVTLVVLTDPCEVDETEKEALVALYNQTGGQDWLVNSNWNTTASLCDWYGVTVTDGHITHISLPANDLTNNLPGQLVNLPYLQVLNLHGNRLEGQMPSFLAQLSALQTLDLGGNRFSGKIPAALGNLSALQVLNLSNNRLTDAIPLTFGNLGLMQMLDLSQNALTGTIPTSIGGLTLLRQLQLENNLLEGNVPSSIAALLQLQNLGLKGNYLSGALPNLAALPLNQLTFANNQFMFKDLEAFFMSLTSGRSISAGFDFGEQKETGNPQNFVVNEGQSLTLNSGMSSTNNNYQWYKDEVPIAGATEANYTISEFTPNKLGVYHVQATNSLISDMTIRSSTQRVSGSCGAVPDYEKAQLIRMYNSLGGSSWYRKNNWLSNKPVCQWRGITVEYIDGEGYHVTRINLQRNNLIGRLPRDSGHQLNVILPYFHFLKELNLGGNHEITGRMVDLGFRWTSATNELERLNLRYCSGFTDGPIPLQANRTYSKLEHLDLTGTNRIGNLPYFATPNLRTIRLNDNSLTGELFHDFGEIVYDASGSLLHDLQNLTSLNLRNNRLSGPIPESIGNLSALGTLDLSYNYRVSGLIPSSIVNIPQLSRVRLEVNSLFGPIPNFTNDIMGTSRRAVVDLSRNFFKFSDLEEHYQDYHSKLGSRFRYVPQGPWGSYGTYHLLQGSAFTLKSQLPSPNNIHTWYRLKNGVETVVGNSKNLVLDNLTVDDSAEYYHRTTNTVVPDLVISNRSRSAHFFVYECAVPPEARQALIDFYLATDGPNWNNNTHWNTNTPVCDWYGVDIGLLTDSDSHIPHVRGLFCNYNNLTGQIPDVFSNFSEIDDFRAAGNNLNGNIPPGFASFNKETASLNVLENNLSGDITHILPNSERPPKFGWNAFVFADFEARHDEWRGKSNLRDRLYIFKPQAKTDQPENHEYILGQPFTLASTAFRSPNNSYQWFKDGVAISGAITKDYTVQAATIDHSGLYHLQATNSIVFGTTFERHPITVSVINPNAFCSAGLDDEVLVDDLTPSGDHILWYVSLATDAIALDKNAYISDILPTGSSSLWWADTNTDAAARNEVDVSLNENQPGFEDPQADLELELQVFAIAQGATVADLMMPGDNIEWFAVANGGNPLAPNTLLVHGSRYFAQDSGLTGCRRQIETYIGVLPPDASGIQFVCDGALLNDLEVIPQAGNSLVWYLSPEAGSTVSPTTAITNDQYYYVAQVNASGEEGFERTAIKTYLVDVNPPVVPNSVQTFFSNESFTVSDLLAFGSNIKWYNSLNGGTALAASAPLTSGQMYYVEQHKNGCSSARIAVQAIQLIEESPGTISCEKFKPQFGDEYVFSAWVREEGVQATPVSSLPFNGSEAADLMVDLLNLLKDIVLKSDKDLDIPNGVYTPELQEQEVDFDIIHQFVTGSEVGETRLRVYNFTRIKDDYGRTIGFEFYLNKNNHTAARKIAFRTPRIVFEGITELPNHYPLRDNTGVVSLNFTSVSVGSDGNLDIAFDFGFDYPPSFSFPVQSITGQESGAALLSAVTNYDYVPITNYQSAEYVNSKVQIEYTDVDGNYLNSASVTFTPQGPVIDGWQKVNGQFTVPHLSSNAAFMLIKLQNGGSANDGADVNVYFDDIRVHPKDGNIKTFVYHPVTQRLMAELDENNYATFYEYDAEGGLVRVKKETDKGIYTIQETRSYTVK